MATISALELIKNESLSQEKSLLEGVFEKTGLACIAGATDTGKSMILRDLAIAISQEEEYFLGFKLNAVHNKVLFISTEDSMSKTAELLKIQTEGLIDESLGRIRFIFNPENSVEEARKALEQEQADVAIIDCFSDAYEGDAINSNETRSYLKKWQKIADQHGCLILFLHHLVKRGESGAPSKHNLHGGQGFQAKMRTVVELRTDMHDINKRHFCIVKGNYLKPEQKDRSFVLYFDPENLRFTSKGEREEYDNLYDKPIDYERIKIYKKASELKKAGLMGKDIAAQIGTSESTISRILNEGKKSNWDKVSPGDDDEPEELQAA
jgi:RecA-family ATPase